MKCCFDQGKKYSPYFFFRFQEGKKLRAWNFHFVSICLLNSNTKTIIVLRILDSIVFDLCFRLDWVLVLPHITQFQRALLQNQFNISFDIVKTSKRLLFTISLFLANNWDEGWSWRNINFWEQSPFDRNTQKSCHHHQCADRATSRGRCSAFFVVWFTFQVLLILNCITNLIQMFRESTISLGYMDKTYCS